MKRLRFLCLFFAAAAALYGWGWLQPSTLQRAAQSGEVIRLHILAADDTEEMQRRKLQVRDALIQKIGPELQKLDNSQDMMAYLTSHCTQIETLCREVSDLPCHAETGVFDFPDRQYGEELLKAGPYQALRITLGEGKGKNWFCVLYPKLCFIGEEAVDPDGLVRVQFRSAVWEWIKEVWKTSKTAK